MTAWAKALVEAELAAVDAKTVADRDLVIAALRRQVSKARQTMQHYSLLYWDLDTYSKRCELLADELGMQAVEERHKGAA
jgi:hypothetical protein